jgi:hypothetical protein
MDTNKIILIYFTMKVFLKKSIYYNNKLHIHFSKTYFVDYDEVNFQNMMNILILVACSKNLQDYNLASQNKNNMHKIQNKITCNGIEL